MLSPQIASALNAAFQHSRDLDASLADRLESYSAAVRQHLPEYASAVDRMVARLSAVGIGAAAPKPGDPMPPFLLPDERGRLVGLEGLLRDGPVAVTFHRGHWCPWCRISVNALARAQRSIAEEGGRIVAIMPDRQKFAAQFKTEANSPFPVLTDIDNGYAMSLDLAIWVGEELTDLLASYGRDIPAYQGNDSWMMPVPATFVVGANGLIAARFVDPDFRTRVAINDLLAAFRSAR